MKFETYMKGITKEDKVALMFHTDADGVASGVIIAKTIEKLRGKKVDLAFCQGEDYNITDKTVKKLKDGKYTKFIVVDQAVDGVPDNVAKIAKFADVMIIDHHDLGEIEIPNVLILKAFRMSDKAGPDYPAAKFCYDLCSKLIDVTSLDWLACVGLLGDYNYKNWKSFVDSVLKKYNIRYDVLNNVSIMASNMRAYSYEKLNECFEVVYNAKDWNEVLNSKLKKYQAEVKKEMARLIKERDKTEDLGPVFVYLIKSKFKIHSPLSSILSFDYIKKKPLVVVADYSDGRLYLSARFQDRTISMNKLLIYAVKDLKNSAGGGHVPSAGGLIMKKDYEEFKRRLVEFFQVKS